MLVHYKIRSRTHQELHSKGNLYNSWSSKGKTWTSIGQLRSYITRCMNDEYMRKFLSEFRVVEFEVREVAVKELYDVVNPEKIMELLKA
jgi:hypothetical protein